MASARKESEVKEYFDEPNELQKKIKKLAELVKKSKHFVVYTGAGISTSCGIADYRSGLNTVLETGAGKWAKQAAHQEGRFSKEAAKKPNNTQKKKKKRITSFKAVPSPSHMALVALAQAGILKLLVSQNTDGLHRRSGFPLDQLSELHGNSTLEECPICDKVYMRDFRCSNRAALPSGSLSRIKYIADEIQKGLQKGSKYTEFITNDDKEFMTRQISAAYQFVRDRKAQFTAQNKKLMNEVKGIKEAKNKILEGNREFRDELLNHWETILNKSEFRLPRYLHNTGRFCMVKGCNGQLTDTIINFGESLPEKPLETAQHESSKADLYLVLGSSCTVTPAADMPESVGTKWKKEVKEGQTPVHNLTICNIQKTPLHHLCSLPMYAKIDDVMIGLINELKLKIPKWYLTRYMKISVNDVGNREDQRRICVSGVDRDGTGFTLFKSVVLRNNGDRIRKVINNKENRGDEWNYIVPIWDVDHDDSMGDKKKSQENEVSFRKYEVDKAVGLTVELEFYGNYEEPKLVVGLNQFLDGFAIVTYEGEIVIKMMMDPLSKEWCVLNKKEQMMDKDVKLLWCIGKGKGNEDAEIKKDE